MLRLRAQSKKDDFHLIGSNDWLKLIIFQGPFFNDRFFKFDGMR